MKKGFLSTMFKLDTHISSTVDCCGSQCIVLSFVAMDMIIGPSNMAQGIVARDSSGRPCYESCEGTLFYDWLERNRRIRIPGTCNRGLDGSSEATADVGSSDADLLELAQFIGRLAASTSVGDRKMVERDVEKWIARKGFRHQEVHDFNSQYQDVQFERYMRVQRELQDGAERRRLE